VVNNLSVSVTKSIVDIDIEKDIKSTFKRSGLVKEDDITVSVTNGIVRLSGTVPNYTVKKQANNIAMYTAGVIDVVDDIVVG
jgi:osmotically-inducible protein OsmY